MRTRPLSILPGLLTGAALAGFFDGIVLHQVLQWHHMVCIEAHCVAKTLATLRRENYYDGLFHAAMLLLLAVGLTLFVRDASRGLPFRARDFWGPALLGGGVFNVLEGLIDHHLLGIHHVRFGPGQPAWDLGFLALGTGMAVGGWVLTRGRMDVGGPHTGVRRPA